MVVLTPALLLQALKWLSSTYAPAPESLSGATACEVQECADVGTSLLARGGSAADALVGMAACVGTIASYHSGFGGDGFALVRSPDGSYESVDFRGAAPANINASLFAADPEVSTMVGGLSVLVPGELRGLEAIHRKHGRLPWKELFQPAIRLAREGFEVNRDLFIGMNATKPGSRAPTNLMPVDPKLRSLGATSSGPDRTYNESFLITDPLFAEVFAKDGELKAVGDIIMRPTYARTLETVAEHGADGFYTGEIAQAIVKAVKEAGGVMEIEDLSSYPVHSRPALSIPYRNHTIYTTQAPSSGSIVLSILNTMAGYAIPGVEGKNEASHRFVESMKFGYGQRTILGDPQFEPNVSTTQHEFLLPSTAAHTRALISNKRTHDGAYYDPEQFEVLDDRGTSAMTAADSSGLVISLTTTVNLYWGSRIMVPEWGIVLNDGLDDFGVEGRRNAFGFVPSSINFIKGRKRPLSSMSPTIVEDANGGFVLSVSSAGGSRIISAIAQVIRNTVDFGHNALEALAAPRLHDQIYPPVLAMEQDMPLLGFKGFTNETFAFLGALGHNATYVPTGLSVACAIGRRPDGSWDAAGDPRKFDAGGSAHPARSDHL